ncbi:hypothetical protein LCGC14_2673190, partial [marine sediment metagenome]
MPSIDQILRERRRAARRVPTAAQEVARFARATASEIARRARDSSTTRDPDRDTGGGGGGRADPAGHAVGRQRIVVPLHGRR